MQQDPTLLPSQLIGMLRDGDDRSAGGANGGWVGTYCVSVNGKTSPRTVMVWCEWLSVLKKEMKLWKTE
jgi:hypothetical protein